MPLSLQIILGAGAMTGVPTLDFRRESAAIDRADRRDAAATRTVRPSDP